MKEKEACEGRKEGEEKATRKIKIKGRDKDINQRRLCGKLLAH
jgi:hypothetical protein